jgi:hypothetical protein
MPGGVRYEIVIDAQVCKDPPVIGNISDALPEERIWFLSGDIVIII